MQLRVPLPPRRKIIVRGYARDRRRPAFRHTNELFIVIRSDPFEGVERSVRQRLENLVLRQTDHGRAVRFQDLAYKAAYPDLHAGEIPGAMRLLPEPARHLAAGASHRNRDEAAFGQEIVDQFVPAPDPQPRRMLPG